MEIELGKMAYLEQENKRLKEKLNYATTQLVGQKKISENLFRELDRLGELELEGLNAKEKLRALHEQNQKLNEKIIRQTEQLSRVKELSSFSRKANELLDNLMVIVGRLDTTVIPDDAPLLINLTEIADKTSDLAKGLRQQLDQPLHL